MQLDTLTEKIRGFDVFSCLNQKDIHSLLALGEVFAFTEKSAVYFPGDPIKGAHFILEGSLVAHTGEDQRQYFGPRDVLGLESLIWPSSIDFTSQGYTRGKCFYLSRDSFLTFIKGDSGRKKRLLLGLCDVLPEEDPLLKALKKFKVPQKKKSRGAWDMEKEIPLLQARPSGLMLFPKLLIPLILLLSQFPLGYALESWFPSTDRNLLWALPSFFIFVCAVVLLALYLQWRSDRLILSTEFLVRKKFLFSQRGWEIIKIPLDQVQALSIKRKGFFQTLFRLNTLEFTTSAENGILEFHHLEDAGAWEEQIAHILEQGRKHSEGLEKEAMRRFLSRQWPSRKVLEKIDIPGVGIPVEPEHEATKGPSVLSYRWREGENLFFRRHPVTLLINSLLPILLGVGIFWGISQLYHLDMDEAVAHGISIFAGALGIVFLGGGIWRFWDWTLDRFMVGKHFLMDWDKKPLWFGEEKKQTELENIQSVSVEKKGVFSLFFNFGDVKILTAGEDMNLVFENVPNPEIIQHEIFYRRSQRSKENFLLGRARRMEEWGEMMRLYEQEKAAGVIP